MYWLPKIPAYGFWAEGRHLSAYHIRKACEDSLRRLKTDHIDLYQMHHIDREIPMGGNMPGNGVIGSTGKSFIYRKL